MINYYMGVLETLVEDEISSVDDITKLAAREKFKK